MVAVVSWGIWWRVVGEQMISSLLIAQQPALRYQPNDPLEVHLRCRHMSTTLTGLHTSHTNSGALL